MVKGPLPGDMVSLNRNLLLRLGSRHCGGLGGLGRALGASLNVLCRCPLSAGAREAWLCLLTGVAGLSAGSASEAAPAGTQ